MISPLQVTSGELTQAVLIDHPTVRAVIPGSSGLTIATEGIYHGPSSTLAPLSSGEVRQQVGVKLLAQNGCNVLYAMMRLTGTLGLEISLKRNPGQTTSAQCGANGYTKLLFLDWAGSLLEADSPFKLSAGLLNGMLTVNCEAPFVNPVQGSLQVNLSGYPLDFSGPAGIRTDNSRVTYTTIIP